MTYPAINWTIEIAASQDWLTRIVQARTGNSHVADDVIQELAVAAANWPSQLSGPQAINRWLYAAAVKQTLRYRRQQARERQKLQRFAERKTKDAVDAFESAEAVLDASENSELVKKAITKLTSRQREVLFLKYYEGWNSKRIAGKFGLSQKTVQKHLLIARRRLREELMKLSEHWEQP